MASYLYGRRVEVWLETASKIYKFYYHQTENYSFGITFTIPFSDSTTAQTCEVGIMNLSKSHRRLFKKGRKVRVYAGYAESGMGLLSEGFISSVPPYTSDGTNTIFTFNFKEGKDAKVKKKVNLSFGAGTKASTIIRSIAKEAGITLGTLKLAKPNAAYKTGYTAKGKPLTLIKAVAKKGGSKAFRRRGVLCVDDLTKSNGHKEHLFLTMHQAGKHGGTGLIAYPAYNEDDDDSSKKTVELQMLLQYQISVGSVVEVSNEYFSGTKRVQSGQHQCDDSGFLTTAEVYA